MGLTVTQKGVPIPAGMTARRVTFDSSYIAGGESLTAADLGWHETGLVYCLPKRGFTFEYDYTNKKLKAFHGAAGQTAGIVDDNDSAATIGNALYVVRDAGQNVVTEVAEASATGLLDDADVAGMAGAAAVLIYLVIDDTEYLPGFQLGHLEFVSPTNVNGTCTVFNGGPTLLLQDQDLAATNGVVVRAIAASGGLEATIAGSNGTCLVPLSDGQFLHIADSTTGSTPSIYFDEDAANTYERLKAEMVDNTDEPYKLAEASSTVNRPGAFSGSRNASLVTVGPGDGLVSQGTVGVGGPEFDVLHDQAAAQMVGATPLYVQAAGAGFNAALPGAEDVYIPVDNGEYIKVAYAASPAGVQVYWDHDATLPSERMKGVIVDNADETYSVASDRFGGELATGYDLSGLGEVDVLSFGFQPA